MKLSEIKGERVFDVIADIIEPVAKIAENPTAKEFFTKKKPPEGMTAREYGIKRVREAAPALLRENKREMVEIFAAINGETPEKYAENLDLFVLLRDCTELMTDDAFISLFFQRRPRTPLDLRR